MVSNYPLMDMKWYKQSVVVDWSIVGFMASMVSTVYYWVYHHEIWNSLSRPSFITILINITSPFWFHELPASNPWTCLFLQYSTWFSKVYIYRGFPIAMLWCLFPFKMQVSPLFPAPWLVTPEQPDMPWWCWDPWNTSTMEMLLNIFLNNDADADADDDYYYYYDY